MGANKPENSGAVSAKHDEMGGKLNLGAKSEAHHGMGAISGANSSISANTGVKSQRTSQSRGRGPAIKTNFRPAKDKVYCK